MQVDKNVVYTYMIEEIKKTEEKFKNDMKSIVELIDPIVLDKKEAARLSRQYNFDIIETLESYKKLSINECKDNYDSFIQAIINQIPLVESIKDKVNSYIIFSLAITPLQLATRILLLHKEAIKIAPENNKYFHEENIKIYSKKIIHETNERQRLLDSLEVTYSQEDRLECKNAISKFRNAKTQFNLEEGVFHLSIEQRAIYYAQRELYFLENIAINLDLSLVHVAENLRKDLMSCFKIELKNPIIQINKLDELTEATRQLFTSQTSVINQLTENASTDIIQKLDYCLKLPAFKQPSGISKLFVLLAIFTEAVKSFISGSSSNEKTSYYASRNLSYSTRAFSTATQTFFKQQIICNQETSNSSTPTIIL